MVFVPRLRRRALCSAATALALGGIAPALFVQGFPSAPSRPVATKAAGREISGVPEQRSQQDAAAAVPLAILGGTLGPAVDAIHNQVLLSYEILPVSVDLGPGCAKTSMLVPPLLAVTYVLLGLVLPRFAAQLLGSGRGAALPLLKLDPGPRALAAVASTCCIIKFSEFLTRSGLSSLEALAILAAAALLQWAALDGRYASLALATLAAVFGPLCELPLMQAGAWHYIAPDYWPLTSVGLGETSGASWAGLASITGPCYFAVTTDAMALGRWFLSIV